MATRGPTTRSLDERIDELSEDMKGLTKSVNDFGNDLKWIKRIGAFIAVSLAAALAGSGRVIWEASAINTEVKQQARLMEEMRSEVKEQGTRLDAMDRKLDTLISRTAPKSGG